MTTPGDHDTTAPSSDSSTDFAPATAAPGAVACGDDTDGRTDATVDSASPRSSRSNSVEDTAPPTEPDLDDGTTIEGDRATTPEAATDVTWLTDDHAGLDTLDGTCPPRSIVRAPMVDTRTLREVQDDVARWLAYHPGLGLCSDPLRTVAPTDTPNTRDPDADDDIPASPRSPPRPRRRALANRP